MADRDFFQDNRPALQSNNSMDIVAGQTVAVGRWFCACLSEVAGLYGFLLPEPFDLI